MDQFQHLLPIGVDEMNEELSMELAKEQMEEELALIVSRIKRIMADAETTNDFNKMQAAYDALDSCNRELFRIVTRLH